MKKILIIILTLLLCTGCFDYKEINEYIAKETRCSIEYLKTNICK